MNASSTEQRIVAPVHTVHTALGEPASPRTDQPIAETARQLVAAGFGLELRLYEPGAEDQPLRPETIEALREVGAASGRPVSAHTSYYSWDPTRLEGDIRTAARLGATVLMVHPSRFGMDEGPGEFGGVRRLCAEARDLGLTVALENVPSGLPTLRAALDELGRDPAATGMGICVDTGHANLSCTADGVPPEVFLRELRDVIVEVHVHDNDGEHDEHLPPGQGTLHWPPIIEAMRSLRDETVVCLELRASADPLADLRAARQFVLDGLGA